MRHFIPCSPANKARKLGCCGWPFRFFYTSKVQSLTATEHKEYLLPWPHYSRPIARRAPLLHRLAGLFLLHRGSEKLRSAFSMDDFLLGVSDAVGAFADALSENRHHDLKAMVSPTLYKSIDISLQSLPLGATIDMDTSIIKGQTMCSVSAIYGCAVPDDEHSIEWLGQKVISSKSQMMKLAEEDSRITFKKARDVLGTDDRLKFVLGVSFFTRACFKVLSNTGQLIQGHNHYFDGFHYWEFSSLVHYDKEYPFKWTVTNINNFL